MKIKLDKENLQVLSDIVLRIHYFREKQNISARKLSLLIGKNSNYINKLECLDFNLTITTLYEIISALNVSEEEFFAKNYRSFKEDDELYKLIKQMPTNTKNSLINFINNLI